MKPAEFIELLIRFLALYFMVKGIFHMLYTGLPLLTLEADVNGLQLYLQVSGLICYAFISAILWLGAKKISKHVASGLKGQVSSGITYEQALTVMFIGVGFYLIMQIIPTAINLLRMFLNDNHKIISANYDIKESLIGAAVYIVLGFYFITGADGLKNIILKIRNK